MVPGMRKALNGPCWKGKGVHWKQHFSSVLHPKPSRLTTEGSHPSAYLGLKYYSCIYVCTGSQKPGKPPGRPRRVPNKPNQKPQSVCLGSRLPAADAKVNKPPNITHVCMYNNMHAAQALPLSPTNSVSQKETHLSSYYSHNPILIHNHHKQTPLAPSI